MWYRKAEGSDPNSNSHFNHRHTLQNISLVDVFPVQCLLVIIIKSSMFLSKQLFLADVYIGKIDINVQKTQYNIFNRMLCIQTVHVTAHKLYMLQHTNCRCYSMQTVHVTAYKLYMLQHTNCRCYSMQTVHVTAHKLYMLQHTNCRCYSMQTVHVTAHKLYMLQHTNCRCYSMQTVHVTAHKLYMLQHTNCRCYSMQTVHVTAYKLYMLQHTKQQSANSHINCLVIRKQCFKHSASQHDRNYIEVFYCVLVMLQEIGWGFWVDITHYKFSHLK